MSNTNPFGALGTLSTSSGDVRYFRLRQLTDSGIGHVDRLPYSIRVLLEACLRHVDGFVVTEDDVTHLAQWQAEQPAKVEIPFKPGRVVLQDFTGVPAVVDLAALRSAMVRMGGDPKKINPLVPCDLVIDHSVQVDEFASRLALQHNVEIEFRRNRERYEFLRWGQQAFSNFRVVPPATGIVHQVNLEYLASVVMVSDNVAYPDSLVGTDSHTTMINGLGRGRNRSGSRHAGAAGVHAHAGSRRFSADRPSSGRRHGNRPGSHRDPDAPGTRSGRKVRGILR